MSDEPEPPESESESTQIDPAQVAYIRQRLESEQNLVLGTAAGLVASIVGAGVWAGVTIVTGYQLGVMAILIGFLVGYAVRFAGKGLTNVYGFVGATLALLGCALGNLLTVSSFVADEYGVPLIEVLSQLDLESIQELMVASFSPMDLLFYGIAMYEGFKLSLRKVSGEEMQAMLSGTARG